MKAVFVLVMALAPAGLWAQSQECPAENATLHSTYVLHGTGFAGGNPFAFVGRVTFDGQGNLTASGTGSVGGTIVKGISGTGTYSVNRDCTGTYTFTRGGGTSHWDFLVAPSGREITFIETDTGTVITATGVRQDH